MAEHKPGSLFTVMFDGQLMVGFSLSITVTVKEHVAVLPAASVTSKVSVVVPTGKALPVPSPAVCNVIAPGQLSSPSGGT